MTAQPGFEATQSAGDDRAISDQPRVNEYRQIVVWPIQLMPHEEGVQIQRHWELLEQPAAGMWEEVADEFTGDPTQFGERHYKEFVTFLPYVQRFLYGEGAQDDARSFPPMRVYRRRDIVQARVWYPGDSVPVTFDVAHVDLHFFYDIDVAIIAVELVGHDLSLARALDTTYRFGRTYPTHWEKSGRGGHCAERVEWLGADGRVLAQSDYEDRARYLAHVCRFRAPCIASHWEFLLQPMVPHHSDLPGALRYREIEYQRMPTMCYLALNGVDRLTRGDLVRLGLVTRPGDPQTLPYSEQYLQDFEYRYCYDRYWEESRREHDWPDARFICSGSAFTVIGDAREPFFTDAESGVLGQYRHQYFLLGLIAHFHRAALLMLSDRLVVAMSRLDIHDSKSVRAFKRSIRQTKEIFLRFTHRYWFHEISDQAQARDLYRMWAGQLGTDTLYDEVRQEILDMNDYLDSDQVRRQADTVVRLTVITVLGLILNVVTGYFGMNLIAEADQPLVTKLLFFVLVLVPVTTLIIYAIAKSKRLSFFLEAMANERLGGREKLKAFLAVWPRRRGGVAPRREERLGGASD